MVKEREFKNTGTVEEQLKKLNLVVPKMMKKLGTKTYGITPPSIIHSYIENVPESGILFRCLLFKGEVKKIITKIISKNNKNASQYVCKFSKGVEETSITLESKKSTFTQELNIPVSDGDYVEFKILNQDDVNLIGVHVTCLISLAQNYNNVIEVLTDNLLGDLDEGI